MDYSRNILADGLTLLTVPMASVRSVTALLIVGVGSRYETQTQRGLAHFLEHMVFKGTQKYPTSLKLAAAVDGIGAEFNAFTGKEYTGFYVKAAPATFTAGFGDFSGAGFPAAP
jgi:predicted Zn-dependent peptidase